MNDFKVDDFFKGIIDTEEGPIVVCNLDYRVIYENPAALRYYAPVTPITGKLLETLMDEEMMSKVRMSIEWFKEDKKNSRVFAFHDLAEFAVGVVPLERRLGEHKDRTDKCAKFTRSHKAQSLEALWSCADRSLASKLEYRIKQLSKPKKLRLIGDNSCFSQFFGDEIASLYKREAF